jgi:hypothetical protein
MKNCNGNMGKVQSGKRDNENNLRDHDYLTFLLLHYLNRIYEAVSGLILISYTDRSAGL